MNAPLKDDLVKLVEFELRYIDDQKKGSGVTGWILFAATGALFWRGLAEIPDVHDWGTVAILWAAAVLFADFLSNVYRELSATVEDSTLPPKPRFFSAQRLLASTRPYLIFIGVKITIAAGFLFVSDLFDSWFRYLWAAFFGFHLFGWLSIVTMTLFDSPFGLFPKRTGRARSFLLSAASLAQISAAVFMVMAVTPLFMGASWPELRFAFLAFAFGEVVTFMLSYHITHPMRDSLLQFRRALVLDTLQPEEIKSRLDVLLHGAEVSKFLQPRVTAYLDVVEAAGLEQDATVAEAGKTLVLFAGPVVVSNAEAIVAGMKATTAHANQATKLLGRLESLLDSFDTRALMVKAFDPRSKSEVDQLLASMKSALEGVKAKLPHVTDAHERILKAYEDFKRKAEQSQAPQII